MDEAPPDVQDLAAERAARRAAKDFAAADALRDRIAERGLDGRRRAGRAGGWSRSRLDAVPAGPVAARDVVSVLDEPATADAVDPLGRRGVAGGRRSRDRFVPRERGRPRRPVRRRRRHRRAAGDVGTTTSRSSRSSPAPAGAPRATPGSSGRAAGVVLAMDGSIEATGDVLGPLEAALADATVGVCGPFGIVTPDLREFDEHGRPGGATRSRATAWRSGARSSRRAGLFDEKFRWYRTADIEYSFRIKDLGLRAVVVPVPGRAPRAPDVVPDAARGPREVVQAELLPVPRSMARPVGPDRVGRAARQPTTTTNTTSTTSITVPSP